MGYRVGWKINLLPKNVKIIDTSAVVNGHSGFLTSQAVFAL